MVVTVEPSIIDYAAQATLTLKEGVQSSVSYQLFKRELTAADYPSTPTGKAEEVLKGIVNRGDEKTWVEVGFFQEKDGKWSASTGNLLEDMLFIVKATKEENKEALWLAQAPVVLVKPNPAPTVGVKALSIPPNTEGMVTVNGTQKGVMYQLRQNDRITPLNQPGFHWEDRGIETTRVEVDFVVEALDDPADYQTLLLPTGVLTAKTTFNVVATKVLTGLSAQLNSAVTISLL